MYASNKSRPLGSDPRQQCGIIGDQLGCCVSILEFTQKVHACKQVAIFDSEEMNRPTYFLRNLGTPKQSKNEISSMFQTSENTPNKIC